MTNKKKPVADMARRAFAVLLAAALSFGFGAPVSGTNAAIESKRGERKDVQEMLGDVRRQLGENEAANEELWDERRELESLKEINEMEYSELLDLLWLYEDMISQSEQALLEAEQNRDSQLGLLKARVRSMYMNTNGSAIEALLTSKDVTSFMEKVELFAVISSHDNEVLEDYKAACADVEYKKSLQTEMAERTGELAGDQRRELDEINLSRAELEGRIRSLESKIGRLASREDELAAQSDKLESEIKELVAKAEAEAAEAARKKAEAEAARKKAEAKAAEAARKKAANSAPAGGGGSGGEPASTGSGIMRWPVPGYGKISSGYGNRIHPIKKTKLFHSGIDIPAATGSGIIATKAGTVIIARTEPGYGQTVVIDHGGGITTLYGHCSKLLVKPGQKVQAGAAIAKIGSTGVSTGPHLHYEVRKNGSPQNPRSYL